MAPIEHQPGVAGDSFPPQVQAANAAAGSRRTNVAGMARALLQIALVVAFVGGGVLGAQRLVDTRPIAPRQDAVEPSYAVATHRAALGSQTPTIQVFGEVAARNAVEMRALVAGPIVEAHPKLIEGETVRKGETLVAIDRFAFEGALIEAEANLAEARARLTEWTTQLIREQNDLARAEEQLLIAERDLERAEALQGRGAGSEQTVDVRRLTVSQRVQARDASTNAVAVQEARIAQQEAIVERLEWKVREARRDLDDTALHAPFDAIVRSENVERGRRLGVNDVVAELYEANALDVRFTVSDRQFGRLRQGEAPLIGRSATVAWSIGDAPVMTSATIDRIGADIASETGGVALFARIAPDAAGAALKPGAFVTVTLADRRFDGVARLPETALYDGDHVFVVVDDRLSRREVEWVAWDGGDVIVRGDLDGAEVLVSRLAEAGDGVLIRRSNEKGDAGKTSRPVLTPQETRKAEAAP